MSDEKQPARGPRVAEELPRADSAKSAKPQEITPEILTVIQTAAAVFVAKKIHAANNAEPAGDKSWSIRGREIVQASHNLIQRGH